MRAIFGLVMMTLVSLTVACSPTYRDHSYFLTDLPGRQKINTLALIGTHNSGTYKTLVLAAQTQLLNITAQLKAGVRVLDIRVRRIENVFAMHHDFVYLGMMFGDIVNQVIEFLREYPFEFVIMLMQEEYVSEENTMTECEILENKYIKGLGNLFVQFWSVEDTIEKHRGKILLARGNKGFGKCTASLFCEQQNRWKITPSFTRTEKWKAIASFQDKMISTNSLNPCYINYLSEHGGIIGPNTIANKFLREPAYFLSEESPPGMNYKMTKYFRNPKNTLYIVMADYPLPRLLDKIITSNFD